MGQPVLFLTTNEKENGGFPSAKLVLLKGSSLAPYMMGSYFSV